MIQHHGPISGIAASGDRFVATVGYDNQVILWDQTSRASLGRVLHDHLANQCAFSPDGTRLITSSSDYTARLWSVPDLRLLAVFNDQEDDVEMSVFHPTKELVATASRDHRVRVYDFGGRLMHRFSGHSADVISVEWARTADELITSSDDGTVKRWSLQTGGLIDDVDLGGIETDTVAIHTDGSVFAGNDEGQLIVLRPDGRETIPAHEAGVKRLVLDGERNLLVSLSYDRTMCLWDVSGDLPELVDQTSLPDDVWPRSCAFAGGTTLVLATFGATYQTYDYKQRLWGEQLVAPTYGVNAACAHEEGVLSVGDAGLVWRDGVLLASTGSLCNFLTPAGPVVVAGGQLGKVFDALTGRALHQHRSPLNCGVTFSYDGRAHVLVGAYTGEGIVLRPTTDGRLEHVRDLRLHDNAVKGVAASGDMLFSVCADGSAAWHSATTLQTLKVLPNAHDRIANGCVGLGGGRFASVSRDLTLRVWEPDFTVTVLKTPHTHSIKCVSSDDTGRFVATGAYDGHVAVHDLRTGAWHTTRPTASGVSSLAYDAARRLFLASSYDGRVHEIAVEAAGEPR